MMDKNLIDEKMALLMSDKKATILREVLEKHSLNSLELDEILLDVVKMAFVSGFEMAIETTIKSFFVKTIE